MLCKKLCTNGIIDAEGSDLFVIFISNEKKQIPLWHQKASQREDGVVLWDYLVIRVQRRKGDDNLVWDLDSTLQIPRPLAIYASKTIRPGFPLFPEYQSFGRILRVYESSLQTLHEFTENSRDGIVHNLSEYMEMHSRDAITNLNTEVINEIFTRNFGIIVNENQFVELFSLLSL